MDSTAPITVTVNGKEQCLRSGTTLIGLLEDLALDPRMVVVEHNRAIVRRGRLEDHQLTEGDTVELVHFVGGG